MSTLFASASGANPRRKSNADLMPRELAFFKRTEQIYRAMKTRLGPKYWKTGRLKGRLRSPGISLPFTMDQFQAWYQNALGGTVDGICKCAYCPRFVTAIDAQVDHVHPTKQDGSPNLDNLALCCGECNRFKGSLTPDAFGFIQIMLARGILPSNGINWAGPSPLTIMDAADIERRLKGGIVYQKTKKSFAQKKTAEEEPF